MNNNLKIKAFRQENKPNEFKQPRELVLPKQNFSQLLKNLNQQNEQPSQISNRVNNNAFPKIYSSQQDFKVENEYQEGSVQNQPKHRIIDHLKSLDEPEEDKKTKKTFWLLKHQREDFYSDEQLVKLNQIIQQQSLIGK